MLVEDLDDLNSSHATIYGSYAHVFTLKSVLTQCKDSVAIPSDFCHISECRVVTAKQLLLWGAEAVEEDEEIKIHPVLGEICPSKVIRI